MQIKYPLNKIQIITQIILENINPLSLEEVAILQGDKIMKNINYTKIHLIDTAISAYQRALSYNSNSQIANKKLNNAKNYKENYLNLAQTNITINKDSYFIGMRRVCRGITII